MIVYFADRKMDVLGQASTELMGGLTVTDDRKTEEIETGVAIFECKIHFDEETRELVKACAEVGNYILRSHDNENEFYTIIDIEENTKKQTMYIYAEDAGLDLLNEVVGEYEADKAYPIDHYVEKFAYDSGFQIGINEATGLTRKLSWDGEATVTARLASVATQFDGCEISYSFDIKGLVITKKYINIYKQRGKDIGVTLRLNRDVDSIITSKSISNLATALRCTGGTPENAEDPITLRGYTYDDGDFYVDGDTLKSRKAVQKWSRYIWSGEQNLKAGHEGHIVKLFSYDTPNKSTLCAQAITELKKAREIEVNYEVDIRKLPDNTRIGDRVNIVDEAGKLYLSSRILKLETSAADKTYTAVIGEHLIKNSGISQKVIDLAAQFAKSAKSAAKALAIANNAKSVADAAQTQADTALAGANAAQQAATDAQTAANTALGSAADAQTKANNAQAAVDNVEENIIALEETIARAQDAADNAQSAADIADAEAQKAAQAAAQALADAADANAAVKVAQSAAETATTKADQAQGTADTAKAEAATAQATADAAKLDAEKAQRDIDALGENLETVSQTMEANYARKTDLTEAEASLRSQISQNAAQISTTVSKLEKVDETVNDAKEQAEAAQATASAAQTQADQATADAQAAQTAADNAAQAATNAQNEANTAKAAAATAQSVADKAEADLVAAQADLASVSGRVDATEADIIAAQNAVTAAQAAADKANADAEAAAKKAEDAQGTADKAVTDASTAQTAANEAANKAALAQQTADEAKGNAATAQAKANEAATAAANAQETANTAKTNAATAQAKANQAATDAAKAQAAADDADAKAAQAATDLATAKQNLANVTSRVDATEEEVAAAQAAVETAQAAADKAKADAATAQSTADTAKANAATAQTAANNAKTAADNAQKAADDAQAAADNAQAAADALAIRVTSAETKITQNSEAIELRATKTEVTKTLGGYYTKEEADAAIKVSADAITSSVSNNYATKQAVNDIEIGGRNLLKNSSFTENFDGWANYAGAEITTIDGVSCAHITGSPTATYTVNQDIFAKIDTKNLDQEYTYSADVKIDNYVEGTNPYVQLYFSGFYDNNGTSTWLGATTVSGTPHCKYYNNQGWVRMVWVLKFAQTPTSMYLYMHARGFTGDLYFKNLKFEKGNKATDWTPAPEDMASSSDLKAYATKSEVTQTADSIRASVSATYATKTALDGLEIGGRNLFAGYGEEEIQLNDYHDTGSFTQFYNHLTFNPCETVGEQYTISFWARSPNGSTQLEIYNRNGNSRHFYFPNIILTKALGDEWQFFSLTVENVDRGEAYTDDFCNGIEIFAPHQMGVLVKKIKVEKGNKATDWTPAPEDMASAKELGDYATKSEVVQTAEAISARVTETYAAPKDSFDALNEMVENVKKEVETKMTSEAVEFKIKTELEKGTSKVVTQTGFTFDDDGMCVQKSGSEMKTVISEDGMTIYQNEQEALKANNKGVEARDLHATTYLIVGQYSRFEDFGNGRTGCFWIGG